ncbi:MAG TPA: helix-turn-helix domain-containing protein [Propionibacteriaceae bacterium]|nr:helix-turn-helix domain-containing protein [Propionibacteriaceae bacterium]
MTATDKGDTDAATPPRRASYANGERRRTELVEAAFRVFSERGFQSLSIRQIAQAIGVSHSLLLHHFGSREALIEAVLESRFERQAPDRETLLEERGLLDALPDLMRQNLELRGLIRLDATLRAEAVDADHPGHAHIARHRHNFFADVLAHLAVEQRRGRLRDGLDLATTAQQLTALVEGLEIAWLYDDTVDLAGHVEAFVALIRR